MKKLIVFLFTGIIFLPLLLSGISLVSDQKLDVELKGYFDEVAEPEFGLEPIKTGKFQSTFTKWFDNTFSPRGVLIKAYNTIRYNLLNLGNQIIGKNKDVFEPDYVNAELCIGDEHDYSLLVKLVGNYRIYIADLLRFQWLFRYGSRSWKNVRV